MLCPKSHRYSSNSEPPIGINYQMTSRNTLALCNHTSLTYRTPGDNISHELHVIFMGNFDIF